MRCIHYLRRGVRVSSRGRVHRRVSKRDKSDVSRGAPRELARRKIPVSSLRCYCALWRNIIELMRGRGEERRKGKGRVKPTRVVTGPFLVVCRTMRSPSSHADPLATRVHLPKKPMRSRFPTTPPTTVTGFLSNLFFASLLFPFSLSPPLLSFSLPPFFPPHPAHAVES